MHLDLAAVVLIDITSSHPRVRTTTPEPGLIAAIVALSDGVWRMDQQDGPSLRPERIPMRASAARRSETAEGDHAR